MRQDNERPHENRPLPPPPLPGYTYSRTKPYLVLIIIGIIILMVGGMVHVSAGFLDDPDDSDDYKDMEEYRDNLRTMQTVGNLIQYIGLLLFSIGMIIGSLKDQDLPSHIRLGMLVAMGIIIGFKLSSTYIALF